MTVPKGSRLIGLVNPRTPEGGLKTAEQITKELNEHLAADRAKRFSWTPEEVAQMPVREPTPEERKLLGWDENPPS